MTWLISSIFVGVMLAAQTNFPIYSNQNLVTGNTPQLVVLTPQTVLEGDETERFEQTYPLSQTGRVSVSNVNGSIVIEAWDRNEVKLEYVKTADTRERLANLEVKISSKPDSLKIETDYHNDWQNGNWNCNKNCKLEVQYKLTVPRTAVLNEIETVNGSVSISNMTNFTKANAVNGNVKATNLRGKAEIDTVNGTTEVDFDSLNSDSRITLSTVNGRVNLMIPSDADATIKADTVNGSISNDFGLPIRKGKYVGRDLYGKVGDGSVKINLDSVNGGLNIQRKKDGKNTKPVVDLLPAKGDDEDSEDDDDGAVGAGKVTSKTVNQAISKSMKDSTRVMIRESARIAESVNVAEIANIARIDALKESAVVMEEAGKAMQSARLDVLRANRELMKTARLSRLDWDENRANRVEEISDTLKVKGTPKVTIEAKNCSVSVRGWDKDEVKYRITKLVRGEIQPNIDFQITHDDANVMIKAVQLKKSGPNARTDPPATKNISKDGKILVYSDGEVVTFPNNAVRIEVFVPKKSNLRILTDREIRIEGITGEIKLDGEDNSINVRDSEGKLSITAGDALIRVIGFKGEIDSTAGDGANFFEGEFNRFSAKVGEGTIILTLPDNANADINANSKINSEGFDLIEFNGQETHRRIGSGGAIYKLEVGDGQIYVRNANLLRAANE